MERDLDFASIQAQLAQLTAQLSQNAERATMPSVPTFGASYGQGYQTQQYPQFSENENVWGYQGHNQSRGNMFSSACNSDWRGNSGYMWDEPQQFQQGGYWQQDEFYSRPMQPPQYPPQQFQSNQSMPVNYNEILEGLISLTQGSQKEEQLPPSEEFYQGPCAPPQPPPQPSHPNYYKEVIQQLNSLEQGREAQPFQQNAFWQPMEEFYQAKELAEQIREQMVEDEPMDELLLLEEDEDAQDTAREEQPLPQLLNEDKVVEEHLEFITEDEVAGEYVECITEDVVETKALKVETEDTGQAITIIINLAKFKVPDIFDDVIFVIEFESEKESKPSSPFLILIFTNNLILMMQAPSLELRPWPEHFKYHRPFSDKAMHLNKEGKPRNHPQSDLHS